MATPSKPSHPFRPFGVVAIISGVLILILVAIIWQATRSLFGLPPSPAMQWGVSGSATRGGGAVAPAMPPVATGMPSREESATDMYYNDGKMMPIAPTPMPGPGADADDRARVGERVIRTGSLTMRVDDAAKRLNELRTLTEAAGGFVASANTSDNNGVKTAYATVRVPNEKFRETMEAAKRLASTVFDESEAGQDVTDQYVDLEARLKAAKAEEAQYLEILKRASDIEDTLNVTARLGEVRSRIEQMEGQMRFLNDRTTYATLSVTLTEEAKVVVPSRVWKPGETFRLALRGLVESLQDFADFLITGGVFLIGFVAPVLLVIGLVVWIVWRIVKRFSRR